ncbi:MAG: hypothetical protein QOF73_342 [Thermomicrobiales bacterium]|nr:hypothetical protein [Thermomicrobiales bacterium]
MVIAVLSVAAWVLGHGSAEADTPTKTEPAKVEHLENSELSRVILTQRAAERLAIETAVVHDEQVGGAPRKVIPYAAVLYDAQGATWTYTSPEPLVYIRHSITVERIEGNLAVLSDGPDNGVTVVTVGAAELYGTEYGVGH